MTAAIHDGQPSPIFASSVCSVGGVCTAPNKPTVLLNEPPEVAGMLIAEWEAYECAKHAWLNQNLDCTAHEYESAMRRILKEIGL